MFQAGGEASNFDNYNPANLGRGSGLGTLFNVSSAVSSEFFTDENGTVFYIEKDADGNKIREEAVDLTLSPTRNPAEAYGRQKNAEKLGTLQNLGLLATGAGGAARAFGPKILNYLRQKIGPKLPSFFAREPVVEVGKYGRTQEFAPRIVGLSDFGKGTMYTLGGAGAYGAIEAAKPKSVDFTGELTELENEGKEKPDGKKDSQAEEKPGKVPIGVVPQTLVSKVISSPDFNRFLSNLSSSLTATGSIAGGGAQAGSESFEEKLEEGGVGFEPLKSSDASSDVDKNNNISSALRSYQTTVDNIGKLEYAKDQIADASGLMGLLGALTTKAKAAIGIELKTPFEEIDPRTQAESLIDAIRQQNIRDLLGESGRTISNLDREIVADIFGSITADMPPSVIRNKLDKVISNFRLSLGEKRDTIVNNAEYFGNVGRGSGVIEANRELIQKILSVPDFKTMYIPKYDPSADVDMTASSGPITDVEYVEGT